MERPQLPVLSTRPVAMLSRVSIAPSLAQHESRGILMEPTEHQRFVVCCHHARHCESIFTSPTLDCFRLLSRNT